MDLGSENFKLSSEEKDLSKVQENSLIILRNFEKIYKLSKRWTFNGLFLLGHMYHKLLTTTCLIDIANSLVPTLFKFLNNLLQLHEKLKNIQIGDPLLTAGREMLAQLLKRDDLEKSQIIEIQLLLATLKPKYSLAYTTVNIHIHIIYIYHFLLYIYCIYSQVKESKNCCKRQRTRTQMGNYM